MAFAQEFRLGSYNVVVKERLAEGGFGFVDLVFEASSKQEYVLKRCAIQRPESHAIVQKEISMLQKFAGPHVVKLLGQEIVFVNGAREALLLLEFCPGGHLLQRLLDRKGSPLPTPSIYRIFGQLILAVRPLHEANPPTVHRDLKLENILFGTDGNLRICDFGSCMTGYVFLRNSTERATAEEIILKETTQMYRSPEMVDLYMRDVLTEKSDIWALGCILYALAFLTHPFQDAGSLGILNGKINMPEHIPVAPEIRTLITRMLDFDPEARPSCAQLFDWLTALARDEPLAPYEIPPEAIQRKQDREAAALRAAQRGQKKPSFNAMPAPPKTQGAGPDPNSVAAKRLAALKGSGGGGGVVGGSSVGSISSNSFSKPSTSTPKSSNNLFDFDDTPSPVSPTPSFSSVPSNDDFFSTPPPAPTPTPASSASFDPFGSSSPSKPAPVSSSFDPFGSTPSPTPAPPASSPFDPFGFTPPAPPSSSTSSSFSGGFDAFAPSSSSTSSSFNPFDSPAPTPSPAPSHSASFDPFGSAPTPAPAPSHSASFDPFGSAPNPTPAPAAFDPFGAPAPTPSPAPAPAPILDLFASSPALLTPTNTNPSPSPAGKSNDVLSLFDMSGPSHGAPSSAISSLLAPAPVPAGFGMPGLMSQPAGATSFGVGGGGGMGGMGGVGGGLPVTGGPGAGRRMSGIFPDMSPSPSPSQGTSNLAPTRGLNVSSSSSSSSPMDRPGSVRGIDALNSSDFHINMGLPANPPPNNNNPYNMGGGMGGGGGNMMNNNNVNNNNNNNRRGSIGSGGMGSGGGYPYQQQQQQQQKGPDPFGNLNLFN